MTRGDVRAGARRTGAGRAVRAAALAAVLAAMPAVTGCQGDDPRPTAATSVPAGRPAVTAPPLSPPPSAEPAVAATPSWTPSVTAPATQAAAPRPRSMAALGDSITRGFHACGLMEDCPDKSWATGAEVDSVARRLGLPAGAVHNDARTGSRMRDLPGQAAAAVAQRAEFVTILLGANDACRDDVATMTPVEEYERQLREGLGVLRQGLPQARVMLVSVPDLARLWEVGRGELLARTVWAGAGVCRSMLSDADSSRPADIERRRAVSARVTAYNDVLRRVCGEWEACRYDGGAVNAYRFSKDEVSRWDWFHPNGTGQSRLADLVTRAGFRWDG